MDADASLLLTVASDLQTTFRIGHQFQPVLLFVDILDLSDHPPVLQPHTDDPVIREIRQPLLDQIIRSNVLQALGVVKVDALSMVDSGR